MVGAIWVGQAGRQVVLGFAMWGGWAGVSRRQVSWRVEWTSLGPPRLFSPNLAATSLWVGQADNKWG